MVRGAKERPIDYVGLHARYLAGESGMEIAASVEIKWAGLYAAWRRLGLPKRSFSEAAKLLLKQHPERSELIRHAQSASPRKFSLETLERRAQTREREMLGISDAERTLAAALRGLGYVVREQMAIGPYNVDLTIESARLIIEVQGGGHSARVRAKAAERRQFIEAQGWRIVHVWAKSRTPDWLERAVRKVHAALS